MVRIKWNNVNVEFVPYPSNLAGGRVWIGRVQIADMFQRDSGGTFFQPLQTKYEFDIGQYHKFQPNNEWLAGLELDDYRKTFDTIEEGLEWIVSKLNEE